MGPPDKLIETLEEKFKLEVFIETGTYKGDTALWASKLFKKVYTIELLDDYFETASENLGKYSNIKLLFGDSRKILPSIIKNLKRPAVFWLDAHMCGDSKFRDKIIDECPLLEEIKIINKFNDKHLILIDDAGYFISPPPPPHKSSNWPELSEILDLLNSKKNRYTTIEEDVIISVPDRMKETLSNFYKNTFLEDNSNSFFYDIKLLFGKYFKNFLHRMN